jgi:hypothetical protein
MMVSNKFTLRNETILALSDQERPSGLQEVTGCI